MRTDVVMPGMSGRDLAARLLSKFPDMKLLNISRHTDDTIAHHGILEEGINFCQKPVMPDAIVRKVREVLDVL